MVKKLSDFKGEAEAFEVIDKLLDPIAEVSADKEFLALFKDGTSKIDIAHYFVKEHSAQAVKILATLAEKDYETFKEEVTAATVLAGVLSLFSDPEMINLFR